MTNRSVIRRGTLFGLAAAVSFGASTPLAKGLLEDVRPQMLAGLLYLGAFVALSAVGASPNEAHLRRGDAPRMALMVLAGGVVAPVLLLFGLQRASGVTGSLLLNLEGPLTVLVGIVIFREHLSRQAVAGVIVVFAGGAVLGVGAAGTGTAWAGVMLIAAACAGWALDNNLTQSLTLRSPRSVVRIKVGIAGAVNVGIALVLGDRLPSPTVLLAVLAVGAVGYGLSVYWDALALRALGAAREAAIFAVAPFVGAALAPVFLPETFGVRQVWAGLLMAFGVLLLIREHHDHMHPHEPLVHDHSHEHDDLHHAHPHDDMPVGPHAHEHRHERTQHAHQHVSDIHHRHPHRRTRRAQRR